MKTITCCSCGTKFGMSLELFRQRQDDGKDFYCPNKCTLVFSESTIDRLKKQNATLEKSLRQTRRDSVWLDGHCEELEASVQLWKRRAWGYKSQWMRLKKRIEQGAENGK